LPSPGTEALFYADKISQIRLFGMEKPFSLPFRSLSEILLEVLEYYFRKKLSSTQKLVAKTLERI